MADWDAQRYLRFADERTRAAEDLLARVPLAAPQRVFDLGCGPGNSTELLAARFPEAEIAGLDSSEAMLAKARATLPKVSFAKADLATWAPAVAPDLLFANAVFQWVPDHPAVLHRLAGTLAPGGVLAVQMPDNLDEPVHVLMREVAADGPWAAKLATAARPRLPAPGAYYDLLRPAARAIDLWHAIYYHVLPGPEAVVDWIKATGLRPFMAPLTTTEADAFLAAYAARIAAAYPPQADGSVLLRFPRFFVVAVA